MIEGSSPLPGVGAGGLMIACSAAKMDDCSGFSSLPAVVRKLGEKRNRYRDKSTRKEEESPPYPSPVTSWTNQLQSCDMHGLSESVNQ